MFIFGAIQYMLRNKTIYVRIYLDSDLASNLPARLKINELEAWLSS